MMMMMTRRQHNYRTSITTSCGKNVQATNHVEVGRKCDRQAKLGHGGGADQRNERVGGANALETIQLLPWKLGKRYNNDDT